VGEHDGRGRSTTRLHESRQLGHWHEERRHHASVKSCEGGTVVYPDHRYGVLARGVYIC
jgi:hypothetical protein